MNNDIFEYQGAIHIHTTDSDGSKGHDEIIELGKKYNLDFLMFTDHHTLKGLNKEGIYDRLVALVGYEINDKDENNHYLAFGLDEVLPNNLEARQYVSQVRRKRGLGIIAHPDEIREHPKYRAYPWTDWSVRGFDGIEIWNHMSAWMENATAGNMFRFFLSPRSSLITPTREVLDIWDREAQKRKVLGIGSIDVHAIPYKLGPFKLTVFPYKVQLNSIRTHILTNKPMPREIDEAKKLIYDSLKRCRAFFSNYRLGSAMGFRFWAESGKRKAMIGESIDANSRLNFHVELPEEAEIHFYHNGEKAMEFTGKSAVFRMERPGVARVEVIKNGKGWIYSNHIHIRKPRPQAKSSEHSGQSKPRRNPTAKGNPKAETQKHSRGKRPPRRPRRHGSES